MKQISTLLIFISAITLSCGQTGTRAEEAENDIAISPSEDIIKIEGNTIESRFNPPEGYKRSEPGENSFREYLAKLPLKPHDSKVMLYNGKPKVNQSAHMAVIDMDIGKYNLQQCADAIMRLWAEYLYGNNEYERIHFNFTNGFRVGYLKWMQGNRIVVKGNKSYWVKSTEPSNTYDDFRKYLKIIFTYAGSLSLSKELEEVEYSDIQPGDIFIRGGSPGHAVIVVDMAVNSNTGDKIYMLAQSYMPAQEIHILKNPENTSSPWYRLDIDDKVIETPEWTFYANDLMRFPDE